MRNKILIFTLFVLGILVISFFPYSTKKEKIHPLTKSWEKAVPHQEVPKGLASLSAEHCGMVSCGQKNK